MRHLLAIMILALGLQPLPAQTCDMDVGGPSTGHSAQQVMEDGHGGQTGCCDAQDDDKALDCLMQLHCNHCAASVPAIIDVSSLPAVQAVSFVPLPTVDQIPAPWRRSLYRPPIS